MKNNKKALGTSCLGIEYGISPDVENKSLLITGSPSSGKSNKLTELAYKACEENHRVFFVGHHGTTLSRSYKWLLDKHQDDIAVISNKDMLYLPLIRLDNANDPYGEAISLTDVLCRSFSVPKKGKKSVLAAVEEAIQSGDIFEEGLRAVTRNLEALGRAEAKNVKLSLDAVLHFADVRIGPFEEEGKILIFDLESLPSGIQASLAELILNAIVAEGMRGGFREKGCVVVLDEIQYFSHDINAPIIEGLRILRKANVSFYMATPEVLYDKKGAAYAVSSLVAAILQYSPGQVDCCKLAKMMNLPADIVDNTAIKLKRLRTGQCFVTGHIVATKSGERCSYAQLSDEVLVVNEEGGKDDGDTDQKCLHG